MSGSLPTFFDGVEFRSRLEAQWAAFFNLLKIEWEYEPFKVADQYTPDFLIDHRSGAVLVEVKPVAEPDGFEPYRSRCELVRDHSFPLPGILLVGASPDVHPSFYSAESAGWNWTAVNAYAIWDRMDLGNCWRSASRTVTNECGWLTDLSPEDAWSMAPVTSNRKASLAGLCWHVAIRGEDPSAIATAFNQECCVPPLGDGEVRGIVGGAVKTASKKREELRAEYEAALQYLGRFQSFNRP